MNKKGIPLGGKYFKMHQKIDEAIARVGSSIRNGKVIAELSFGFWIHMLDSKFDVQNIKLIKGIFPLRTQWNKSLTSEIKAIRHDFDLIGELRNRVAHHEPIFHQRDLDQKFNLIIRYIQEINPSCINLVRQVSYLALRRNKWQSITFP